MTIFRLASNGDLRARSSTLLMLYFDDRFSDGLCHLFTEVIGFWPSAISSGDKGSSHWSVIEIRLDYTSAVSITVEIFGMHLVRGFVVGYGENRRYFVVDR